MNRWRTDSKHQFIGILLALVTSITCVISQTISLFIIHDVAPQTITLLRCISISIVTVPFVAKNASELDVTAFEFFILMLSSFFNGSAAILHYRAIEDIIPVDAVALHFTSPIIALTISAIFLKEKYKLYHFILTILVVTSVFMICQPSFLFDHFNNSSFDKTFAMFIAFLAGFSAALTNVATRFLKNVSIFVMMFFEGIFNSFIILVIFQNHLVLPASTKAIAYLVYIIIISGISRLALIEAMKRVNVAIVSSCLSTEVIFTMILQILFLEIYPNKLAVIGSFLLSACVSLLPLYNNISNLFKRKEVPDEEQDLTEQKH